MRARIVILVLASLVVASVPACSSKVPPTVTMPPRITIDPSASIYVSSNRNIDRVVQSLRDAGLRVTNTLEGNSYALVVKVGRGRGSSKCGTTANVVYILNYAGQRVMILKGRGKTGDCAPNAFNEMSNMLATYFLE